MSDLSERYEEHHRERRDEGDFVFVPERIPLFVEAVGRGKRVLDLGCRSGQLTKHFLEGNSVVGLDVDAAALEKAAALGIEPVQANVEEPLPFEDASFDAVVAGELFEHLQFPDALVAEIRRVLRPGGVLVGSVPNAFRVQSRLRFLRGQAARGRSDAPPDVLAGRDARAARRLRAGGAELRRRPLRAAQREALRTRSGVHRYERVRIPGMDRPETQFAWSGESALAYQVLGDGEPDLVYMAGWISNVELNWDHPSMARFLRTLARERRLIALDARGMGCSERSGPHDVWPLETIMEDVAVVLDAAGSERAVLVANDHVAFVACMFAA